LADIEVPDLDQQVSQARAALAQALGQFGQAPFIPVDTERRWDRFSKTILQPTALACS
jgi:hypothetical protein